MKTILKNKYFFPVAVLLFFALAYNEQILFPETYTLNTGKEKIEKRLKEYDRIIRSEIATDEMERKISSFSLTDQEADKLLSYPFSVFSFHKDSLVYWSNNTVIPQQQIEYFHKGYNFFKFRNGFYIIWKKNIGDTASSHHPDHLVVLIPVKYQYNTENDYLRPDFAKSFNLPDYLEVSMEPLPGSLGIHSPDGQVIFYLSVNVLTKANETNNWIILFFLLGFLFLIFSIHILLQLLPIRKFEWLRILIPVLLLISLYYLLSDKNILPPSVRSWNIFDADIFASPDVAFSLGSMLLQCVMLLWVSVWFYNNVLFRKIKTESIPVKLFLQFLTFSVVFFIGIYFNYAIKGLVRDSKISFRFYNPFNPDNISLIAIFCITALLFSFFIITYKLLRESSWFGLKTVYWWLCLLCAGAVGIFYFPLFGTADKRYAIIGSLSLLILIIQLFRVRTILEIGFVRLFILLVLFSSVAAWMIQYYGHEKEITNRITFSKKLFNERDNVTEYLLDKTRYDIRCDNFVMSYFVNQHLSTKDFSDRIRQLYFGSGFNRYEIEFVAYNASGNSLKMDYKSEYGYFGNNLLKNAEQIEPGELYFSSNPTGNFSYISVYPIFYNDIFAGRLIIILNSKIYREVNVYPELLLEEKNKIPEADYDYSYAIYNHEKLIDQGGDYPYSYINKFPYRKLAVNEPALIDEPSFSHLLLKQPGEKLIVVTTTLNFITSFLSYFSYLFIVLFLLLVSILSGAFIKNIISKKKSENWLQRASFRNIIQISFIIIIFLSVIVIGIITGRFFISQFNKYTKNNLALKLKMVDESVNYLVQHTVTDDSICGFAPKSVREILNSNISSMADVHDMDINFFDSNGNLITTSQPAIFERGIISKKINAAAYYDLMIKDKTLIIQKEKIGDLTFLSGYHPVRNNRSEIIALLNIPYFNTTKNLNEQIGFFFSSLVNILVFALIVAGFLAPFISNRITSKLSFIAEKFKFINLSRHNELIEWNTKDELGQLVTEFNKMVVKLDESAQLLAKSERESAWREMAKQVAHEIKNPLTPMKLSIQHLQRAYAQNDPRIKEMTERVTVTLIEQIDNLSRIATEFSSFAKMPKPENELLHVHEILKGVAVLFSKEHQVKIEFSPAAVNDVVNADRSQLIQVFNNLVLNGIQSIPEGRSGLLEIVTLNEIGFLVINFKDNGSGMTDEVKQRIFTPSFTTKSSGTGLGLAICKSIIDLTGGSISFDSIEGQGTVFCVKLPLDNS